ncbi:MAG TPA: hypothetical protein VJ505_00790 [Holophagaceae bacterium]|nr:hypothetical protein [Holophagaceae bacterium]
MRMIHALLVVLAVGIPLFSNPQDVVIAVNEAKGYAKPDDRSEVVDTFDFLGTFRMAKNQGKGSRRGAFVLLEGTRGKKARKYGGARPDLWVKRSDIIFLGRMKRWNGCMPIETLDFIDGTEEEHIDVKADGTGEIANGDHPIRVITRFEKGILDIGGCRFVFDPASRSVRSPLYEDLQVKFRACE